MATDRNAGSAVGLQASYAVNVRIPTVDVDTVVKAAAAEGKKVSTFIREAAVERAKRILKR